MPRNATRQLIAIGAMTWITVMNPDGIANDNRPFAFGDTCVARSFIRSEPVAPYSDSVLHRLTGSFRAFGTECPPGTLFLMPLNLLRSYQNTESAQQKSDKEMRKGITDLLRDLPKKEKKP